MVEVMISELSSFYNGKRVLVTGNTGFKGTWLSLVLECFGAKVWGYSLPITKGSFFSLCRPKTENQVENDISNVEALREAFRNCNPEIVIHLASHSSLQGITEIPEYIFRTNCMGVLNVLERVREFEGVKSVIIVTSDKCYKNIESEEGYTEDAILDASDPYSSSKVCQELITKSYRETFWFSDDSPCVASARASNIVGPGDDNNARLVPYLLECFSKKRNAVLRNPEAIRSWQFVLDVVLGYLLLAKKLYEAYGKTHQFDGAYNFGPSSDGMRSVLSLVESLSKRFENPSFEFQESAHGVKETKILRLNSYKAKKVLGWSPMYSLEDISDCLAFYVLEKSTERDCSSICREIVKKYFNRIV